MRQGKELATYFNIYTLSLSSFLTPIFPTLLYTRGNMNHALAKKTTRKTSRRIRPLGFASAASKVVTQ